MAENGSDDANPHGIPIPGREWKLKYPVGINIPKTRDWKKPRWLPGHEPTGPEEPNEYFEESDPAPPHGIPRPKLKD